MASRLVSFIIPIPPEGECELSLASIRRQNYPRDRIEVLVAIGRHRSIQRNKAIARAAGDFIFFLDNDVIIADPDYINKHLALYDANPTLASIGGPSLTPATDTILQQSFGQVLASSFATQSIRARYWPVGRSRQAGEKELILCNQSMRASIVRKLSGFNPEFHSGNEENEMINRIQALGFYLWYDPQISVERSQRRKIKSFLTQIAKYGKSRVEHFLIKPKSFELKFLAPLAFLFYMLALPLFVNFAPVPQEWKLLFVSPLALYVLLAAFSAAGVVARSRSFLVAMLSFCLYPLHHAAYGAGNLIGLYRYYFPGNKKESPVVVERLAI